MAMITEKTEKPRKATTKPPTQTQTKTLGPIADLERHLPSDWWRNLFNAIYLKTDGDVVENKTNTRFDVDLFLKATGIAPHQTILDLCCGQGRHLLELAERGFRSLRGIDRSRYLIRLAKKRVQKSGFEIKFSEGDARNIRLPDSSVDCITLFGNSFGYFERKEDDIAVLQSIKRVLKSSGKLVLDLANGNWLKDNFEKRSWEWIDEKHFVCRERSLSHDGCRIISREVVVSDEKGVIADQFYAERLYTFEEIKQHLESLNFRDVVLVAEFGAESDRNQDLGMMANRFFITATGPEKAAAAGIPLVKKKIAVVMGDPRKEDKVKLGGKFNSEDLDTINKFKESLKKMPQFEFSFFDNHETLLHDLRTQKPPIAFNICDEGFRNDAKMELHVPAFLEMLGIPYTGAGPACLAMCYNKNLIRALAASLDIPVPLETYFDPSDQAATLPSILPALLKPNIGDSSIGITQKAVVHDSEALVNYINFLNTTMPGTAILIQELLTGEEYSVAILGNPGNYTVLPILNVDYSGLPDSLPKILSYESKWDPESPYWTAIKYKEAKLSPAVERQLVDASTQLFERLECRDYARFDFREDAQGVIKLLEVNPNPGWCWDGKLNIMAGFAGKSYSDLLADILDASLIRLKMK